MQTIDDCFRQFKRKTISSEVSARELEDRRRTFYAGCFVMFDLMTSATDIEPEDAAVNRVQELFQELQNLSKTIS